MGTVEESSVREAIQVLVVAACAAIIIAIFLRIEESTARRMVVEANKCYDQGQRAVLIRGEIQCRK